MAADSPSLPGGDPDRPNVELNEALIDWHAVLPSFNAAVLHDLANVLTSVQMKSSLMEATTEASNPLASGVKELSDQAAKAGALLRQAKAINKPGADGSRRLLNDLATLMEDSAVLANRLIPSTCRTTVEIPASPRVVIRTDAQGFAQALIALAAQFAGKLNLSGDKVSIHLRPLFDPARLGEYEFSCKCQTTRPLASVIIRSTSVAAELPQPGSTPALRVVEKFAIAEKIGFGFRRTNEGSCEAILIFAHESLEVEEGK